MVNVDNGEVIFSEVAVAATRQEEKQSSRLPLRYQGLYGTYFLVEFEKEAQVWDAAIGRRYQTVSPECPLSKGHWDFADGHDGNALPRKN